MKKNKYPLTLTELELAVLKNLIMVNDENTVWDPREKCYRQDHRPGAFLKMNMSDYAAYCSLRRKLSIDYFEKNKEIFRPLDEVQEEEAF